MDAFTLPGDLMFKVTVDGDMVAHIGNDDLTIRPVQVSLSPMDDEAQQREAIVAGVREFLKRWDGEA